MHLLYCRKTMGCLLIAKMRISLLSPKFGPTWDHSSLPSSQWPSWQLHTSPHHAPPSSQAAGPTGKAGWREEDTGLVVLATLKGWIRRARFWQSHQTAVSEGVDVPLLRYKVGGQEKKSVVYPILPVWFYSSLAGHSFTASLPLFSLKCHSSLGIHSIPLPISVYTHS